MAVPCTCRITAQDSPLAERRERGALALTGGRGLPGDFAEERADGAAGSPAKSLS
jgi:hypothetical protein